MALEHFRGLESALPSQAAAMALYMICQTLCWNLIWKAQVAAIEARQ